MHEFTPEVLYADTAAKKRAYGDLSHRYATAGHSFGAVHAAFASDAQAVQAVMWERVMVASPAPDQQFKQISDTVSRALVAYAAHPAGADTAREAVEQARAGLGAAFDATALKVISKALLPVDHLDHLPAPTPQDGAAIAAARTHGETPDVVARKRLQSATESMSAARALNTEGRLDAAMARAWEADWATFESYLLDAAAQVGDTSLITVEMRWALATDAVAKITALPSDFEQAVTLIRNRFLASLGTIEGSRLSTRFEPIQ